MAEEAKVRVKLDTSQAKRELDGIGQAAEATGRRAASGLRRAVGAGFKLVGAGAAFGTGMAAVKAATTSGIGDIAGETFGGWGAWLNELLLGKVDDEARAKRRARQDLQESMSMITGMRGHVPDNAEAIFNQTARLYKYEEVGRSLIEQDTRFRGPGLEVLVAKIIEDLGKVISDGLKALGQTLLGAVGIK